MTLVRVVGGGLAGCEAAFALSRRGYEVELWDLKPSARTPAHHSPEFGELVCSNSLKSDERGSSGWLLKEEMRRLGSALLPIAESVRVPSGGALSVDRALFSRAITTAIEADPRIRTVCGEYVEPDDTVPTILATGPLTSGALYDAIRARVGSSGLSFFDAAAPIVDATSVDRSVCFCGARNEQTDAEYLNCPLTEAEYRTFVEALCSAESVRLKDFEGKEVFEGCMPIEVMAKRGPETLRFGPLKPTGLGTDAYAVVQLRAENLEKTAYNLVGFQTNLTIPEQRSVFRLIPALRNAEFFRYGVMHRNSYLDCPRTLDKTMKLRGAERIYVAGQLSGVEGYVESMASGLAVARYLSETLEGNVPALLPRTTMIGALLSAITIKVGSFQPVNAHFGLLPPMPVKFRNKTEKYAALCERALRDLEPFCDKDFDKSSKNWHEIT